MSFQYMTYTLLSSCSLSLTFVNFGSGNKGLKVLGSFRPSAEDEWEIFPSQMLRCVNFKH